jgi:flavodoxin I
MKKTIVVYGSSTGTCEGRANEIASKLGTEAISVSDLSAEVVTENENLILGTITCAAGEVQYD